VERRSRRGRLPIGPLRITHSVARRVRYAASTASPRRRRVAVRGHGLSSNGPGPPAHMDRMSTEILGAALGTRAELP
jgi:hypothetical protein